MSRSDEGLIATVTCAGMALKTVAERMGDLATLKRKQTLLDTK